MSLLLHSVETFATFGDLLILFKRYIIDSSLNGEWVFLKIAMWLPLCRKEVLRAILSIY